LEGLVERTPAFTFTGENKMFRWVFLGNYGCKLIGNAKDLEEFLNDYNEENETSYKNWREFNEDEEWYVIVEDK